MLNYPEQFIFEISGIIDTFVDWILDTFGGLFDVITEIILSLFFAFDFVLGNIPW
jgi:ABC-type proline/glycine betaine transport system permease subunit